MTVCNITITSKNKQSLHDFVVFISNVLNNNLISGYKKKNNKRKVITVLKSPHVNKVAQEQFEYRIFSIQFLLSFHNTPLDLVILKNIKSRLFPDIKIKIKFLLLPNNSLKTRIALFRLDNYSLNMLKIKQSTQLSSLKNAKKKICFDKKCALIRKTKNYLKLFDCYGELNLNAKENVA